MPGARILIVDDDASVTTSLSLLLKRHGFTPLTSDSPDGALEIVEGGGIDLVLQDMNFSRSTRGEEGLLLISEISRRRTDLPVILITAWGSISLAVQGIRAGAVDFITKPWGNAQLLQAVETALALTSTRAEHADRQPVSRADLDSRYRFDKLIGHDPKLLNILDLAGRVSATDASVLITGESGTGKELLAEGLHRNSRRSAGPFVKVNLAGISSTLFESEMFGHVKGAFTDARSNRKGRFELAHRGTIFLDEIGDVDPSAQVKLLRVLQDRSYEVLGSSATQTVDARVISATNRNLAKMVEDGEFREDLLYRLNLISLHLPPLRERPGDLPLLTDHFLETLTTAYGRPRLHPTHGAREWLARQQWPGNLRQLKQTLERAVLVVEGKRLDQSDLEALSELGEGREGVPLPSPGTMTLDQMEQAMIERSLDYYEGNVSRVADALGLSRGALYRRLQKFGLEPTRR